MLSRFSILILSQNKKFLKNLDISAFHLKNMPYYVYNSSIVWPSLVFKLHKDEKMIPTTDFSGYFQDYLYCHEVQLIQILLYIISD